MLVLEALVEYKWLHTPSVWNHKKKNDYIVTVVWLAIIFLKCVTCFVFTVTRFCEIVPAKLISAKKAGKPNNVFTQRC